MAKQTNKKKEIQLTSLSGVVSESVLNSLLKTETSPKKTKGQGKAASIPSPAYHIFQHSITRSKNLLQIHEDAHGKQAKPEKYLSDIHRAAVVLAISALDAFVCQFVTGRITILLSDNTKEIPGALLNKIKEATEKSKPTLILDAVKQNNIRQIIEKMLHEEFEKKTFQGTESIASCLKIVGYEDIFNTIASKAKMHEGDLKKHLNEYTNRRHTIVHRGDFDASENPPKTENPITKTYANNCIKLIEKIAKQINELK